MTRFLSSIASLIVFGCCCRAAVPRRGDPEAAPLLIRLLGDDDSALRALAAKGLGVADFQEHDAAVAAVTSDLKSRDRLVRQRALPVS